MTYQETCLCIANLCMGINAAASTLEQEHRVTTSVTICGAADLFSAYLYLPRYDFGCSPLFECHYIRGEQESGHEPSTSVTLDQMLALLELIAHSIKAAEAPQ